MKFKNYWKRITFSVLMVILIVFIVKAFPFYGEQSYADMSPYVETSIKYANGTGKEVSGLQFGQINKGDVLTLTVSLPLEKQIDQGILAFGINHVVGRAEFEGRLLDSYGEDIDARGDMVCHHNYFVKIPEEAWGKSVTITMRATENKAFSRLVHLWLYPSDKAYKFYFDFEYGRMVVSNSVMVISLATMLAVPFLLRMGRRSFLQLFSVSLFGIISSLWMMLAEGIQQFYGLNSYLLTTFEYVAIIAQVLPLGMFVYIEEKNDKRRQMLRILLLIDALFVVFTSVMNYTNTMHFSKMVSSSLAFIGFNGVALVFSSMASMDFSVPSKRISLLGVSVLCMAGVFDVTRFSLYRQLGTGSTGSNPKTFPLGVMVFFIFILISVILKDRELQENERRYRAKLLASQIQPHFLYNTLAAIREVIFEDPPYAAKALSDFTVYLRGAVRAMSDIQVISFADELRNIRAYVSIEQMRMEDRLDIEYDVQTTDFAVPPLSIQPIVENSIRHGIFKRGSDGGKLTLKVFEDGGNYNIVVSDTGVGFDVKATLAAAGEGDNQSVGLKNLISRLRDTLKADVEIDSKEGVGTTTTVKIPKEHNRKLLK